MRTTILSKLWKTLWKNIIRRGMGFSLFPKNQKIMEEASLDQLPDDVLCCIISLLSFDEAARTSILSKRWKTLWKNLSILDFDATHMINPLSNLKKYNRPMCFDFDDNYSNQNHARKYDEIVRTTMHRHLIQLTSCRFKHFPRRYANGDDVDDLVKFVLEKNKQLSSLILECLFPIRLVPTTRFQRGRFSNLCSLELTNYVFSCLVVPAFECCEKLKTLKLEKIRTDDETINGILKNCLALENFSLVHLRGLYNLKIHNSSLRVLELGWLIAKKIDVYCENLQIVALDSLICSIKHFQIYSQDLRVFSSYCLPISKEARVEYYAGKPLKTRDILYDSQPSNIFRNLLTLLIELDLNNIKECSALASMLRSCDNLNTLDITIPVGGALDSSDTSNDRSLPFPESMFWERHQIYNFFNKLRFATVRGFTGKELEVNFVKHLITKVNMVEKLYVICDSSIMEEATNLLSLRRASVYLSIILKSERRNHTMSDDYVRVSRPNHVPSFF